MQAYAKAQAYEPTQRAAFIGVDALRPIEHREDIRQAAMREAEEATRQPTDEEIENFINLYALEKVRGDASGEMSYHQPYTMNGNRSAKVKGFGLAMAQT